MSDLQHELPDEFPEHTARMEELKAADESFAKLYDEYHRMNAKVIAAETHEKPTDHFHEEEMKKKRAFLKDQIYKILSA